MYNLNKIRLSGARIKAVDGTVTSAISVGHVPNTFKKENMEPVKKRISFTKKEVVRLDEISGSPAPTTSVSIDHCLIQNLIDYASENENIWKYDQHEKVIGKLANLYFSEYITDEKLRIFLVKFFIFIDSLSEGKNTKIFWVKNMNANTLVKKEDLTLIGQRYFDLLNKYYDCEIKQKINDLSPNDFFKLLTVFDIGVDVSKFWKVEIFTNQNAIQLNESMSCYRKKLITYKIKFSKNFNNINYINEKNFQRVFTKDRWVLRFELTSFDMKNDVRLLSKTFADLMKRLKGEYRLSEDIKYIKFINEKNSRKKYLDVLFFIEVNEKFNSMKEVIDCIQDNWTRAISYTQNKNSLEDKIWSSTVEIDSKTKLLMESETLFNFEYLYVGLRDKTKIKAVVDFLIPYFISQAIFLPVESNLPKTRQLTLTGFGVKY